MTTDFSQAQVGIVFTQAQAIFSTAGEHPVRLLHPLRDQVINQHPEIRFIAARRPAVTSLCLQRGIDPGQHTLGCGFFVTGRAIDLTGKEQALDLTGFE